MTSKSQNIINVLQQVYNNLKRPLIIAETGTIRNLNEGFVEGDGYSTQFIAEWVRDHAEHIPISLAQNYVSKSQFYSIDIDIETAAEYLTDNNLIDFVSLWPEKSVAALEKILPIDFCYLDSSDDPDNCLAEFMIAWPKITKGGALMADDCSLEVAECTKGYKLIPYLIENNIPFEYKENKIFGKTQIVLWK